MKSHWTFPRLPQLRFIFTTEGSSRLLNVGLQAFLFCPLVIFPDAPLGIFGGDGGIRGVIPVFAKRAFLTVPYINLHHFCCPPYQNTILFIIRTQQLCYNNIQRYLYAACADYRNDRMWELKDMKCPKPHSDSRYKRGYLRDNIEEIKFHYFPGTVMSLCASGMGRYAILFNKL